MGLERIAITDHGTIRGSIKAKEIAKNFNIEVVIGSEIKTDWGDIIGLYLNDEIKEVEWEKVISDIRSQGGISVLPHPYRGRRVKLDYLAKKVDFIEIWNSRSSYEENKKAQLLANSLRKKILCGSDAHCLPEIGLVKVLENLNQYTVQEPFTLKQTINWNIKKSRIIHLFKKIGSLENLFYVEKSN
jgi:hypothetical protein